MPSRRAALQRLPIALLSIFVALLSPALSHGSIAVAPQQDARPISGAPTASNVLAAERWRGLRDSWSVPAPSAALAPAPAAALEPAAPAATAAPAIQPASPTQPAEVIAQPRPTEPPLAAAHPAGGWYDDAFTATVRNLVNGERAKVGLGPLSVEPRLTASAAGYAKVLSDDNWFSHVGPDGSTLVTRAEAAGFPFTVRLGEVLAWGNEGWTPAGIVQAWMHSPTHREEILSGAYIRAGTGCYFTPAEGVTVYCVMDLAG